MKTEAAAAALGAAGVDIPDYLHRQHGIVLTGQQRQAIEVAEGSVLLLAVPGAGKTTVLTARVAHLLCNRGVAPTAMLNLTFNRAAAHDMGRRFELLFGQLCPQPPRFSTIHSFCLTVLRDYAAGRGTRLPRLLEQGRRSLLAAIWRQVNGSYITEDRLDELENALGYCVNRMLPPEEIRLMDRELPGFAAVRQAFERYKRENHLMDFDQMLAYAHKALAGNPPLRQRYSSLYSHIHVDEAQDTSLLLQSIIQQIAGENLFMVGDEDQSIYRFRGAYPKALLDFGSTRPDARILKLEENFRSTPQIISGAAGFIAHNRQRYSKGMVATRPAGEEPVYTALARQQEQYAYISRCLAKLPPRQTAAVLYRTAFSAAPLADRLQRDGVAFCSREGRTPFTADSVVKDIMAFIRLAQNPADLHAFSSVYYKLGCYITREIFDGLCDDRQTTVFDQLTDGPDFPGKSTARLGYLKAVFRNIAKAGPAKALQKMIDGLDYLDYLQSRGEGAYQDEACAAKLAALASIAEGCPTLEDYLDRLEQLDGLLADSARNTHLPITLSTVHTAKGREFDRVYLVDLLEGVFPVSRAIQEGAVGLEDALEEEARLFYVAMTRAKNRLELIWGESFGEAELTPSRFIQRLQGGGQAGGDAAALGLRRGVRVVHYYFGMGQVTGVDKRRRTLTAAFPKWGSKTFGFDDLAGEQLKIL